jgi:hypothetical protein
MDAETRERYRRIIQDVILEHAKYKPSHGKIRTEVDFQPEIDHYGLIRVGWSGKHRIHGFVIHIDIVEDKIWIEHDGTSPGVALELVERGIPHEDIVLGFWAENIRPLTDFGVAPQPYDN